MNITKANEDQHWAALMTWAAGGIKSGKHYREYSLQEMADGCYLNGLFPWLLDGEEIVDVLIKKHLKITEKCEVSLRIFFQRHDGQTCSLIGTVQVVEFRELQFGHYRVEFLPAQEQVRVKPSISSTVEISAAMLQEEEEARARILAKLCVSADNKVVSIGKLTFAGAKALEVWAKDQVKELRPPAEMNASLDIETWGTAAGSAVSAIGGVKFTVKGIVGQAFYMRVDIKSCIDAGLTLDAETMVWWMGQKDEARQEVCKAGVSLRCALEALAWWLCDGNGRDINVWGNGWDFDGGRLGDAYKAVGMPLPWHYAQGRDLRTLEAEHPEIKDDPEGVEHNALDDARGQALKIIRCWEAKQHLAVKAA